MQSKVMESRSTTSVRCNGTISGRVPHGVALIAIVLTLGAGTASTQAANEASAAEPAAGTASYSGSAQPAASKESYSLDSGDHLKIQFYDRYDRDDLNGEYVIGESGQIRLPRIGIFDARNKLVPELERDIRLFVEKNGEKLGYFSIEISRCRPFYVAGLANRPGSYSYVPGLTVMHAVVLAGGLYRSPSASLTDAMREKRTLTETLDREAEFIARRERLRAERDGVTTVVMPKELIQLAPKRAGEMIESERTLLQRTREVESRERAELENIVALTKAETDSYRAEIGRIEQRIEDQTKIFYELKKLHDDRVINQQRFFEAVAALDASQRDKQLATAGLSHASSNLEKAEHDLSMLTLASSARIAKELSETEREISRLREAASQTQELVASLNTLAGQSGSAQAVNYRIMRRDKSGQLSFLEATETTAIKPGDVVEIVSRTASTERELPTE